MRKKQIDYIIEWLENYINFETTTKKKEFSLDTMRFICSRLENPQNLFKSIHIAGSKGKGSTAAMLCALSEKAGNKTGLYTSPHLFSFTERITHNQRPFLDSLYGEAADTIVPLIDSLIPTQLPNGKDPTWFELVTLLSFVVFARASCTWAVFETGLGGRLDATNVIDPQVSIITPIELEHTDYLGNTLSLIAKEKAGIIKQNIPVFFANQKAEAQDILTAKAQEKNADYYLLSEYAKIENVKPSLDGLNLRVSYKNIQGGPFFTEPLQLCLKLNSLVQAENAALAAYVSKFLFPTLSTSDIQSTLSKVSLPGRFEVFSKNPPIVLDGAHTKDSLASTLETFKTLFPEKNHVLFACAADKDVDAMTKEFLEGFSHITVTRPGEIKQSNFEKMAQSFKNLFSSRSDVHIDYEYDYKLAIQNAVQKAQKKDCPLLVTGSFYLVAEFKSRNE